MLKDLTLNRLKIVLERLQYLRILVIGDFVLDQRWTLSQQSSEETQTLIGSNPHYKQTHAGAVTTNLLALGVGKVTPIGLLGADGYGWQIRNQLSHPNCDLDQLFIAQNWVTPSTIRPMASGGTTYQSEQKRYELRSDQPLGQGALDKLINCIKVQVESADAVILCDPFPEKETGFFTAPLRIALSEIAAKKEQTPFWVDSPYHFLEFDNMTSIVNTESLMNKKALKEGVPETLQEDNSVAVPCYEEIQKEAIIVRSKMKRPVFVNLNESGIMSCDRSTSLIPGLQISGEADLWGGEEAVLATATAASATGASSIEAAQIGVLAAAEVYSQLESPGVASSQSVLKRFAEMPHR